MAARIKSLICCLCLIFSCSCASMFGSGPETLTLQSQPSGATYQYGSFSGKTPDTITVPRAEIHKTTSVSFSLPGYETKTMPVDTHMQGVTWLDILFWPGFIVDLMTGNAYALSTPTVTTNLTPTQAAAASPPAPAAVVTTAASATTPRAPTAVSASTAPVPANPR